MTVTGDRPSVRLGAESHLVGRMVDEPSLDVISLPVAFLVLAPTVARARIVAAEFWPPSACLQRLSNSTGTGHVTRQILQACFRLPFVIELEAEPQRFIAWVDANAEPSLGFLTILAPLAVKPHKVYCEKAEG